MEQNSYELLKQFRNKFPGSVSWRLKKHCKVIDMHLNPNERVNFIFSGQLDIKPLSLFNTGVIAVTNERLIIAQKKLIVGYKFSSITPDLYNDLTVKAGIIWGTIIIDTVREQVYVSDLGKDSLPEIETEITMFMQEAKKKYAKNEEE